jgi:hypothetical protein
LFSTEGFPGANQLEAAIAKPIESMSVDFSWAADWRMDWETSENLEQLRSNLEMKEAA